ncbi:unnamed protein product [Scytosiphon promiscuus]
MATFGSRVTLGARVTVTGKKGVVKFIGPTEFAAGDWIGVELDLDEGKNNGVVNGVQYFDCREGHGLFVKKAQVRLDRTAASSTAASSLPDPKPSSSPTGPTVAGRASSRLQAIREKNKALKETLAAGKMSPQAQRRAFGSPLQGWRSPGGESAQEGSNHSGSPSSVVSLGSAGGETRRGSQAPPGQGHDAQAASPRLASGKTSAVDWRFRKAFGDAGSTKAGLGGARTTRLTGIPSIRGKLDPENSGPGDNMGADESFSASPMPPPPPPSQAFDKMSMDREMDTLRARAAEATSEVEEVHARLAETATKLSETEACRRELEGRLSSLQKKADTALGEERFNASAQAKEKAAAATALRREADMESQMSELTDACEALTLDKEQLAIEKEDLQEKVDELRMELDSAKLDVEHAQLNAKENEAAARALSAAGGAGDGSVDVKMLAEQNLQLKEALKRLHTHGIAEKSDLTKAIRSLEKEATLSAALKEEVDRLRSWKESKATEIEDLMEQLDESKAYEEMVESLTTKNLEIGERCSELEAAIVDLESSVELSEELEVQQAEDIRELQTELTAREVGLHNQKLALESVVKELQDTKQTVDRFREYADQLKASRDELAAASKIEVVSATLSTSEKRAFLTQKALIEKMATECRRAKMSETLLQVDLLDAQARSSRVSMLLPGSLLAAEAELRSIDADLSACRLARKASIALELLELPALEFVDMFAVPPEKAQRPQGESGDAQVDTTLDRATAMEDCSRLALEAEQSLPIARTVGEALAVLGATVSTSSRSASPQVVAAVSLEVVSALIEAEELVDDLLRVIQDEGGLRPAGSSTTVSALVTTTKSIGIRRTAALTSSGITASSDGGTHQSDRVTGGKDICAAFAALQDCLVCARRAVLSVTGAALRGADASRVSSVLLSQREDGISMLWQSVRGLWGDLITLRSAANTGSGSLSTELERLALGGKGVLEKISLNYADARKIAPAALEWAKQVTSIRLEAKNLLRSPLLGEVVQDGARTPPLCPSATWRAVAPWLVRGRSGGPGESTDDGNGMAAPCVIRAAEVRASLEQAIDLKPDLEAAKTLTADLTVELASKSKELIAATSKREQLEALLEKAEGSQVTSTDLQKQVLLLQGASEKFEQENKFMAEALEDLQDSTSRLEAENRTLRTSASQAGRSGAHVGTSGKPGGSRCSVSTARVPGRERSVMHTPGEGASSMGQYACVILQRSTFAAQESKDSLISVLKWSRAETARWRGRSFTSAVSGLKPLPHLSCAHGRQSSQASLDGTAASEQAQMLSCAGDSLMELRSLSKELAAVRTPPRVVGVKGATRGVPSSVRGPDTIARVREADGEHFTSSASTRWQQHHMRNARLAREWRKGHGRANQALSSLLTPGEPESVPLFLGKGALLLEDDPFVCVARLRLPSDGYFRAFQTANAMVPVKLCSTALTRLQQALAV